MVYTVLNKYKNKKIPIETIIQIKYQKVKTKCIKMFFYLNFTELICS